MAGSKDFKLAFGVDVTELVSGLAEAKAAVVEAATGMKESLASVNEAFGLLGEAAVAITGIMAGGAAFKEMVSATVNLNVQSLELGKQFGISATQASVLKVALGETFLTQDQLSAAGARMTRTLNTNEGAFKQLGVSTRDAQGNFRSTLDIMTDVNARLLQFKEGTDRNIEGTKIYGRGWQEVSNILRLTKPAMEEAAATATELNLVVTKEGEAATQRYRSAMVSLKDVFEGIRNTIGEALLPVLSSIGEWFRENGPQAIAVTRAALATLGNVFITVREGIENFVAYVRAGMQDAGIEIGQFAVATQNGLTIAADAFTLVKDTIGGEIQVLITTLLQFAKVAGAALQGDFIGAKAAWDAGTKAVVDVVNANMAKIKVDAKTMAMDWSTAKSQWKEGDDEIAGIDAAFLKTVEKNRTDAANAIKAMEDNIFGQRTATAKSAASATSEGGPDKNLMAKWDAELAQAKLAYEQRSLAQGSFQEYSKQQELEFWEARLATGQAKGGQELTLEKKIADLKLAINKQNFDTQIAGLKEQEAQFSKNADARIGIAKKEAEMIGAAYGTISPQYEAAMKHVTEVERQALEQQRQIADVYAKADQGRQLELIAADEKDLQQKYANHLISVGQLVELETELENKRNEIEAAGIQQRLILAAKENNPVLEAQLNAQLEAAETAHQAKLTQIQQQAAKARQAMEQQAFNLIENSFNSTINELIRGTMTFSNAMRSMLQNIVLGIVDMLAKWAEQWAVTQILNLATAKTSNVGAIASQAAVAGAAGTASFAGAPWPVDIGAPAFGASMFANAMSYAAAAASAAGGYDIPSGVSPVTQLHPREMVLPEQLANVVRGMAANGGGGGGDTHFHAHINALDTADVKKFMSRPKNRDAFLGTIQDHFHSRLR
jgi:hypothetical protein